jgi:hypothetical protein
VTAKSWGATHDSGLTVFYSRTLLQRALILHGVGSADYTGGSTSLANVTTYVQANNSGTPAVSIVTGNAGSGFFLGRFHLSEDSESLLV